METKTIEAFLILANCLNFTKSAERVYISQPALSRQIARLEEEFDCEFFIRNKRTVELTRYGVASTEYAQRICNEIDRWKLRLKQLRNNEEERLRIGFLLDFPHDFFPRLIQTFAETHPQVEMSFSDLDINGIVDGVLHGDLDCGFSLHNDIKKFDQIDGLVVSSVKMCAVLPTSHALAVRASVKMEELADSGFVMVSADNFAQGTLHIRFLCKTAGFEPKIVAHTNFVPSMLMLVKCGVGIAIVAESAQGVSPEGVCFVPIDNKYAAMEILLFWKKHQKNPALPLFIKTAESLM
jgi:DNA-binding transcriptional LysR family regulator